MFSGAHHAVSPLHLQLQYSSSEAFSDSRMLFFLPKVSGSKYSSHSLLLDQR